MASGLPEVEQGTLAIGWATVELDRAVQELMPLLERGGRFVPATGSSLLGASALIGYGRVGGVVSPPESPDRLAIVLLEPSTEGRVAAGLARHGEGWLATWTVQDSGDAIGPGATGDFLAPATGTAPHWSAEREGPLGRERLRLGGPIWGPHRLLVQAATIGR